MPSLNESAGAPSALGSALRDGIETLSLGQEVTFIRYVRVVLPLDGYVFWVNSGILSQSALLNASVFNAATFNEPATVTEPASTICAKGSLHYVIKRGQNEAESVAVNQVIFTSEDKVENLDSVGPYSLYVGEYCGLRFAFSERSSYYRQANLHHYVGDAVYPDFASQIIDNPGQLDINNVVVSNSLPLWLNLSGYQPFYGFGNPVPLFPSYLIPPNLTPPYGVIHIHPESTIALQDFPRLDSKTSSHTQLASERVRVTLIGVRNNQAQDFVDCVNQYSRDYDYFGLMNTPILRDEKRTQQELNVLAIRKSIDYEISYRQTRVRQIAQQIISQALVTVQPLEI